MYENERTSTEQKHLNVSDYKQSLDVPFLAAFRPTGIGNLAFAHKGFIFNSFSIVYSVMTFRGIVFFESLLKR